MRKTVAAVTLASALLGPAANAGAAELPGAASAVSETGSAALADPVLCAPVIGGVVSLFYNPYGPLLPQICAMR
ncbi:MAG TPA: hypothetical protein VK083_09140 [Nocardia sp.]|uniref:hypothetical protein n=1 Tax=Nocardia TaxID=1817 RepID=UPI002458F86B|nr:MULTISPECIES: hypothetical protein [Nocardia]HLS76939.1 hypothetical protein [Nocardia sp.]